MAQLDRLQLAGRWLPPEQEGSWGRRVGLEVLLGLALAKFP